MFVKRENIERQLYGKTIGRLNGAHSNVEDDGYHFGGKMILLRQSLIFLNQRNKIL